MSWEVLIQRNPPEMKNISELPEDYVPKPLCSRIEFEKMMKKMFPNADLQYYDCIEIMGDGYCVDINSGEDDPIDSLMLRVRGNKGALDVIQKLYQHTGWKAVDLSSGEYIDFEKNPDEGFAEWRAFNAQACAIPNKNGSESAPALETSDQNSELNEYLVSLENEADLSALKKGFNWGALFKGPLFVFEEFGKPSGIVAGIGYILLFKILYEMPIQLFLMSPFGIIGDFAVLLWKSKILLGLFVYFMPNLFLAIFAYRFKEMYLLSNRRRHCKVYAADADDAMMMVGEKLRGY